METTISKKQLLDDIVFYLEKIDEVHPEPYKMVGKNDFANKIVEIKQQISFLEKEDFTLLECFFFLQEIAALIQDGHTTIQNPISARTEYYIRTTKLFPFDIVVCEGRFFVKETWFETCIPRGAEILSINGIKMKEIFNETMKFASATLEKFKLEFWSTQFPAILESYYRIESPWLIEYINQEQIVRGEVEGKEWTEEVKKDYWKKRYAHSHFTFRVDEEEVPVLVIPSLNYQVDSAFKSEMGKFFEKFRDSSYLVIDMRRNPGGNGELGWDLLKYLSKDNYPFETYSCFDFRVSKPLKKLIKYRVKNFLHAKNVPNLVHNKLVYRFYTKGSNNSKFNIRVLKAKTDDFVGKQEKTQNPKEQELRFRGKVFFLVSSETFSAGVVTVGAFKHSKMGKVIGRETGGRVGFFSDPITIELPTSKLRVSIPTAIMNLVGGELERGVTPDVEIKYTPQNYLNQVDEDFVKVEELIRRDL